jgi:hypothetical protein
MEGYIKTKSASALNNIESLKSVVSLPVEYYEDLQGK